MSARVLVADGDTGRAQAIARACTTRGFVTRVVHHGAAALEASLSDVPDVIVCQLGLPLIDGSRLEGILRANPRTRAATLLYLGDQPEDAERRGLGGRILASPIEPERVAGCVAAGLGERATETRSTGDGAEGEGQLADLPLADVLDLFHVNRKTGTVEVVHGPDSTRRQVGRVMLRAGDVVGAGVGDVRGKKALFRLLAWDRGSCSFWPGAVEDAQDIHAPTRALLAEGMRQVREWERMAVDLPPLDARVALRVPRSSFSDEIHSLTREVLEGIDRNARVRDVVDHCAAPDYPVLCTLQTLIQRGAVDLTPELGTLSLTEDLDLFDAEHAARLREWLELDRRGGGPQRDAKVVVLSARPETLRDFASLVARLPGVDLNARLEVGTLGAEDLVPLGRVRVDTEVGIELVHVPAGDEFAPAWPVAGHGALATLVLISGPLGQAVANVRAACEGLATGPDARMFHLLLLGKGEQVAPEDAQQHLASADHGSLFPIPIERADEAELLLREMFVRVLPRARPLASDGDSRQSERPFTLGRRR